VVSSSHAAPSGGGLQDQIAIENLASDVARLADGDLVTRNDAPISVKWFSGVKATSAA
jgi:hypothetical protein